MNSVLSPLTLPQPAADLDKLEVHVQARLNGRVRDLRLLPHEHGLVIKGWAMTYYAKQLAQHLVMEASARPILANEIEVA